MGSGAFEAGMASHAMGVQGVAGSGRAQVRAWREIIAKYRVSSTARALWQVANTFIPYVALWAAMWWSAHHATYWLTIPLAVIAGLFLIRIFIIFHDCGHGSFFKSRWANDALGIIAGFLTFTPYYQWRWEHAIHHSTAGHLDKRGIGDIWTMTVQEYLESGRLKRFAYELARHPFMLFVLAPIYMFLIHQRFSTKGSNERERLSVWWTNLGLLLMMIGLTWLYGFWDYFVIQLIPIMVAGSIGVWMFYVQHQFEDVYWERGSQWDYAQAALRGSSFYKLPSLLQWFSGNIGFHHIHHLSARIPNYNLQQAHEAEPIFQQVKPLTLWASFKTANLRLWDEGSRKLVSYRQARELKKQAKR